MPRPNPYTKEMDDFIRENMCDKGAKWVIKGLKENFGFEPKYQSLFSHCQRYGIKCSYRNSITEEDVTRIYELQDSCSSIQDLYNKLDLPISYVSFHKFLRKNNIQVSCNAYLKWEEEWDNWLIENIENYRTFAELAEVMCEKFDADFTRDRVQKEARNLGLHKKNSGNFKSGGVNYNTLPIGTEWEVEENGQYRVKVKVAQPNVWRIKQTVIWEQIHNDVVKPDEVVIFLNGNRHDFSPENLRKIKRNVALNLGKSHMRDSNADITKTAVLMWELHDKIKNIDS